MRKIMILIVTLVMAFSATVPIYAEPYTAGIEHWDCGNDIGGLAGNFVNQSILHCKKCYTRTATVYCPGTNAFPIGNAPCATGSHAKPCTIENRYACIAYATCSYCGTYFYDAEQFQIWEFPGHVERCTHSTTGNTPYPICPYGPKA